MPDPLFKGDDLSSLKELPDSPKVQATQINDGWAIARTVTRQFQCRWAVAPGLVPGFGVSDADFSDCKLRDVSIEKVEPASALLTLTFKNPDAEFGTVSTTGTIKEMDVGILQNPLALHPRYAGHTFDPDSGKCTGGAHKTEFNNYLAQGVEFYYIPTPIFRKTSASATAGFSLGNIGKREYPGSGVPGGAANWLKTAHRVSKRPGAFETTEEWTYSADGWDSNLYS